jgi:voltage-gated potassium channel
MSTTSPHPESERPALRPWQQRLHEVIFEADSAGGKAFDVVLLIAILLSIAVVMLESIADVRQHWGRELLIAEWIFTFLFTAEYALRLVCVARAHRYALSFFGLVDLLAILPAYLSLVFAGSQSLIVIRALRLLRVFRIFKLGHFLYEARTLIQAARATSTKVIVFMFTVMTIVLIMGSAMYLIEGPEHGFTSIPRAIYWAIVTMTTVGYGDLAPSTILGQTLAAAAMIIGYCIIAVPTGIFSFEFVSAMQNISTQACGHCSQEGHDHDAVYCKYCGEKL